MKAKLYLLFQTTIDDETENASYSVEGDFQKNKNGYTLSYEEIIDGAKTDVTIVVKENTAEIRRKGPASVCFPLEVGKSFPCDYKTPYGALCMQVEATAIKNTLSPDGGHLLLSYNLEMGGGITHHVMNLDVKKVTL